MQKTSFNRRFIRLHIHLINQYNLGLNTWFVFQRILDFDRAMATSLGYVLMNWTSEFARHSKTKKNKKKHAKNKENLEDIKSQNDNEINPKISKSSLKEFSSIAKNEVEVQTEDCACQRCEEYEGNVEYLEQQLSDAHITQESLKQKLSKTKATLATTIERESRIRDVKESLELEEAQVRYEFEGLKTSLLKELEERDHAHSERIQIMEQVMNSKDCEWASKNELLQKELRTTLRSALQDTEREEHSLTSLEQEIDSLRTVIEMRSSENKELRNINEKLTDKIEHQSWLEAEIEKAKRRLEELALIVQNKMVSERELLELSEALQRDLVQSRSETLHYKQQIENRQYLQDHNEKNLQLLHKVKHSQNDLFNNQVPILVQPQSHMSLPSNVLPPQIINNDISKQSLFLSDKPSNLQKLTNWVNEDEENTLKERMNNNVENNWSDNNDPHETNSKLDHRNQHQKASFGSVNSSPYISSEENEPSLVVDVREKTESVAWVIQMPPSPNTTTNDKRRKRN